MPSYLQIDSCWTWFNSPNGFYLAGANKTCFGGSGSIGSTAYGGQVLVSLYDHTTNETSTATVDTIGGDDHNNPGVIQIAGTGTANDNKILACWAAHPGTVVSTRRSTNVASITAFDAVVSFGPDGTVEQTGDSYEYCNLAQLSSDNTGRIYLFYTVNDTHAGGTSGRALDYRYSDDQGTTWSAPVRVTNPAIGQAYFQISSDGVSRVDFSFTQSHPSNGSNTSQWHFYMTSLGTPAFTTTDGTSLTLPIDISTAGHTATQVFDGSTVASGSWSWDITGNGSNPAIVFAAFVNNPCTDHRYRMARWNGSSWVNGTVDITPAGSATPHYLYSGENFYSGGITVNRANINEVFLSYKNSSGGWDIQRWTTANSGTSWTKAEDVTSGNASGVVAARPVFLTGTSPPISVVYWQGTYTSFNSYNTNAYASPSTLPLKIIDDPFTDTAGTSLLAHYALDGGIWNLGSGTISAAGRVYGTTAGVPTLQSFARGTDVSVQCDFVPLSFVLNDRTGILCRADDSSNFYMARPNMTSGAAGGGVIELFSCVAGAFTQLGSSYTIPTMTAGNTYVLKMIATGSDPTQLTVVFDGVTAVTFSHSAPAAALQTNNRFGFRFSYDTASTSTTGQHWDNFLALDIVPIPASTALDGPPYRSGLDGQARPVARGWT